MSKPRYVTIGGETKTVTEWAKQSGINRMTLYKRLFDRCPAEYLLEPIFVNRSRRTILRYSFKNKGENLSLHEWSEKTGISYGNICSRLQRGWTLEEALEFKHKTRKPKRKYVTIGKETKHYLEWLKIIGISKEALRLRIDRGMSLEEALTTKRSVRSGLKCNYVEKLE
jgi:hypothetical protein